MGNQLKIKEAVEHGNVEALKKLLKGVDLEKKNYHSHKHEKEEEGTNLLHLACSSKHKNLEVVKILLEHGERVNGKETSEGRTPIFFAVLEGERNYEVIELLLACGTDLNARDSSGKTILHHLLEEKDLDAKLIQRLVKEGMRGDMADVNGKTVLECLMEREEVEESLFLEFLKTSVIEKVGKGKRKSFWEYILFDTQKYDKFINCFLEKELGKEEVKGLRVFGLGEKIGKERIEKFLAFLNEGNRQKMIDELAFDSFFARQEEETVKFLFERVSLEVKMSKGEMLLEKILGSHISVNLMKELATSLLETGTDPSNCWKQLNSKFKQETEALVIKFVSERHATECLCALIENKADIGLIKTLLEKKFDLNLRNKKGNTALFEAFTKIVPLDMPLKKNQDSHVEYHRSVVSLLVSKGADINAQNDGATVLSLAFSKRNKEEVGWLLELGANPNAPYKDSSKGGYINHDKHVISFFLTNLPYDEKFWNYYWHMPMTLVYNGGDPNVRDSYGATLLHHRVAVFRNKSSTEKEKVIEDVQQLAKHGANVNIVADYISTQLLSNCTPLDLVLSDVTRTVLDINGKKEVRDQSLDAELVVSLLERGADLFVSGEGLSRGMRYLVEFGERIDLATMKKVLEGVFCNTCTTNEKMREMNAKFKNKHLQSFWECLLKREKSLVWSKQNHTLFPFPTQLGVKTFLLVVQRTCNALKEIFPKPLLWIVLQMALSE